jgi:hypothetical protein
METPFDGYTVSMFNKKVVEGGHRPKPDEKWSNVISSMMKQGWGPLKDRPSMQDVSNTLRDEINRLSDTEVDEILDISRKSEMSAHGVNPGK